MRALEKLGESYSRGVRLQEGVPVAFVGLPNAGKSSFFNALLGEERAIVSEQPGTTRDVLREQITLRSGAASATFRLHDTAGLRSTDDAVEKLGIGRTGQASREADIVVLLVEPASDLASVLEQWRTLAVSPEKTLGVLTKSDLLTPVLRDRLKAGLAPLGAMRWLETSSVLGTGITEAVAALVQEAARQTPREKGEVLLTRLDQVTAVKGALAHLARALETVHAELLAADLRQALFALVPLIGDTLPDDILGRIFSDFCIGK